MAVAAASTNLFLCSRERLATSDAQRTPTRLTRQTALTVSAISPSITLFPPHQPLAPAPIRVGQSQAQVHAALARRALPRLVRPQQVRRSWRVACEESRHVTADGIRDAEISEDRAFRASGAPRRSRFAAAPGPAGGLPTGGLQSIASSRGAFSEDGQGVASAKRRVQGPWRQHSSFLLRSVDHAALHSLPLRSSSPSSSFSPSFRASSSHWRASAVPASSAGGSAGSISLEADALMGTGAAQEAALAEKAIARAAAGVGTGAGALTVAGGGRDDRRRDSNVIDNLTSRAAPSSSDSRQLALLQANTRHKTSSAASKASNSHPLTPGPPPSSPSLRLSSPASPRALPLRRRPFLFPLRLLRVRFRLARRALRALTLRQAVGMLLAVSYWLRWPLIALALMLGATWQMRNPGVRAARPVAYSDMVAAVKAGRVKNAAMEESSNRIWFNMHSQSAADVASAAADASATGVTATSAAVSDQLADKMEAATAAPAAPAAPAAAAETDIEIALTSTPTAAVAAGSASAATPALAPAPIPPALTSPPSLLPPSPTHASWRSFLVSLGPPWSSLVRLPADPPFAYVSRRIHNDESFLLPLLITHNVRVASVPVPASQTLRTVLLTALTVWIPVAPLIYLMMKQLNGGRDGGWRRGGGGRGAAGGKGGGKGGKRGAGGARGAAGEVRFEDVAGVDEAKRELMELVQGIKGAGAFAAMGAHIPKGVLLIGPPGTGKTLLARVVAAEADVPFFAASASEFVEMFVGRGAARVRELFREARKAAPAIVFIDEIDAVGARRGASSNDERDQTLNQLLTELDGFDSPDDGVLLLAATNRLDTLDPALTRSGRISRRVMVPLPDVDGRRDILRVHMRRMGERMKGRRSGAGEGRVGGGVVGGRGGIGRRVGSVWDLLGAEEEEEGMRTVVARYSEGFSGADLENVVNEAAWLAARSGEARVSLDHFLDAVERTRNGIGITTTTTGLRIKPRARGSSSSSSSSPLLGFLSRALGPLAQQQEKDVPARAISPGI